MVKKGKRKKKAISYNGYGPCGRRISVPKGGGV